jgi:ABC-type nickel/cobalt efflux system permease component RcnA
MWNITGNHRCPRVLVWMFGLILCSATSFAHPMGNFSINHYSKLKIGKKWIEIRYLIDMAEIPTFQEMRQFDIGPAGDKANNSRYLDQENKLFKDAIALESDGRSVALETVSRQITFADGAGGLPTMKIGFVFRGKLDSVEGAHKINYADNNFPGRAGWKEIVVLGDGVTIRDNSASGFDRSQELTNYSSDVLNSPPQQVSAQIGYRFVRPIVQKMNTEPREAAPQKPNPSPIAPRSLAPNTPRSRFTELISTQSNLSFWVLLSAALIAAGLGALHALEPGHGKTIVAAYLVGSRGTAKHAVLLGMVVTAAHTAGVYVLGAATLYASRYIVPEQLYPWLGAISGLSVAGLGIFIFLRQWTGETGEHSHTSGERHSHWFLSIFKQAEPTQQATVADRALSLRELCMLGITGGIVPCPAALVVLLSAFSLHRIGFGLFLITAFSLGLAAVLVVVGLTMVYAKRAISSRMPSGGAVLRYLPFLSASFMVIIGIGITVSALSSAHIGQGLVSTDKLVPFVTVILLGLFLGMRHSTDPDHVVAVSTIVSRQGSVRSSATIGLLWGLGHTLTIFLVGSAIIIFGVVIPPRLGLSMEFCVALMLILLGVLNLTGVLRWITQRFDRVPSRGVVSRMDLFRDGPIGKLGVFQTIRPLAVGLVHGLAGSAAVALLVLSTIKSPLWSTAYLLVFGFGTMAGMMLMTAAISMPLVYSGKKFFKINSYLIAISGFASMAFGIFLVYQIGFVDGLFTSQAHWIPQ